MLQILEWGRFARLSVDVFDEDQTDDDLHQFSVHAWLRVARRHLLTGNGIVAGVELGVAILWVFITSQAVGPVIIPIVFVVLSVEIGYLRYLRDQAVKTNNYAGSLLPAATWPGNRHDLATYPFYERAMMNHIHLSILLWLGRILILATPTDVAYGAFTPSIAKDVGLILFFICFFVLAAAFVRFVRGGYTSQQLQQQRYVSVSARELFTNSASDIHPPSGAHHVSFYSDTPTTQGEDSIEREEDEGIYAI